VLPQWAEVMCIALGAIAGSLLAWRWQSARLVLAWLLTASALTVGAWAVLLTGGWLPLLPTLLSLGSGTLLTASQATLATSDRSIEPPNFS